MVPLVKNKSVPYFFSDLFISPLLPNKQTQSTFIPLMVIFCKGIHSAQQIIE